MKPISQYKLSKVFILSLALPLVVVFNSYSQNLNFTEDVVVAASEFSSRHFKNPLSNQVCTEAMRVITQSGGSQSKYKELDVLLEAFAVECGISEDDPLIEFKPIAFQFENEKLLILWDGQYITINEQAQISLELTMPENFEVITVKKSDIDPKKENRLLTRLFNKADGFRNHLKKIYDQGEKRMIISGYAYHSRGAYTAEKIDSFNEAALGFGIEKVIINEKGNRESVFAMIFLDSHNDPQPAIGYNWQKGYRITKSISAYIGASAGLTMRSDMMINDKVPVPLPFIFPTATLSIGKLDIQAVYSFVGDVVLIFASYPF